MDKANLHRQLSRQLNKYLSDDFIAENENVKRFVEVVNQSYFNFEKDVELFEQSSRLNDIEFHKINKKLKGELEKKENIQTKLIQSIKQLNNSEIKVEKDDNLIDLLNILNKEIEFKKEFENRLFEAKSNAEKANEAKSDFLSIMSHEIRTPLNAIIGLIYIMEKENTLESFQENLEVLKHSSQNLFLLINDILDFNKIEAGKIDIEKIPFNFKDLVIQIGKSQETRALENLNKIEVIIDDNFIPNVISDPLRIGQVITNLVSNAIKFTKNGLIQIKIDQIRKSNSKSVFKVQVIDSGIGIDLKEFDSIFQKFAQAETRTTRQFGGTGLGLAITKKLLNLLNSDIELESEIGVGSNFSFVLELPIVPEKNQPNNSILNNDEVKNLDGLYILLVEDNLINVKIADKILRQWNVEIDVAENGLIAIEKFKQNKYDIILMDLSMPVMDGYEATKIIRSTGTRIPIIALTASSSYDDLEKIVDIGMNEYVIKPFNPDELYQKLRKYY
ncbi:response regulator [Flavobacterium aestivum]|uniref:response regulator n=1 Tax=Flavobacterium aestivum TaxID=3003257 RepID=UPI0024825184|nr:response regulator [Flavobacterium aestivum]